MSWVERNAIHIEHIQLGNPSPKRPYYLVAPECLASSKICKALSVSVKVFRGQDTCSSDPTNGPEFVAGTLQTWLKKLEIKPIQIYPGSPWENGYNERFNGTLRRKALNAEWFSTIRQAQIVI